MKINYRLYLALLFSVVAHLSACSRYDQEKSLLQGNALLTGEAHVYDGDSIFFGKVEVRLNGIDAPERDQACRGQNGKFWPCGMVARDVLRHMVSGARVQCVISEKDRYRRLLGICYANGRDLNAAMVERGDAIAYHYFSEKYASQERRAKANQLGIWGDAEFSEPYYCRHFTPGHVCYEFDYIAGTGRVATQPLIGKSRAVGVPN